MDISWVQWYKMISRDEILDRFVAGNAVRKAPAGGDGRELSTVEIVERHFGKHTGLPPSTKACPRTCDNGKPAAKLVEAKCRPINQRQGLTMPRRGREAASIREKAHGSFVRQDRWRHLVRWQAGAVGRCQRPCADPRAALRQLRVRGRARLWRHHLQEHRTFGAGEGFRGHPGFP